MIANKVCKVADELCEGCAQLWEGECRAFCVPHSDKERQHRMSQPRRQCRRTVSITGVWRARYGALTP